MTRYGVDTYGECTYGVEGAGTTLLWGLDIAWQTEGVYTGTNYAQYMTSCQWSRGRRQFLENGGKGIAMPEVGQLTFELDNPDGLFDVTNSSSPLYPDIEPGKYTRLRVRVGEAGTAYNVFTGIISDIQPVWGGINPKIKVTVEDGWSILNAREISLEYAANCTSSVAMASILSAANYPALWGTSIATGNYQIPYFTSVKDKTASQVIKDLINFEFGGVAVAADGKFISMAQSRATSPAYTITQDYMLKDVQIGQSYNGVRNAAKVNVYLKWGFGGINSNMGLDPKVVWSLDEIPEVASHETYEVWGYYQYADHDAIAVDTAPVTATTDYTMNADSDGGGTDRTGQFTVTATSYGDRVKFEVYNAGTTAAYITLLQIRGWGYYTPDTSFVEIDNSTTTKRTVTIDSPYIQTRAFAKAQADRLLVITASEVIPQFQIEARPERQFEYDLLDEVTLNINKYAIRDSYIISHIEGEWLTDNGQAVLMTYKVETGAEGGL